MTNTYIREYRTDGSSDVLNHFFSESNIHTLQYSIIVSVKSATNIDIGPQSKIDLLNFMHKHYKLNANTQCPGNIQNEILRLNKLVVQECVHNIIFNMQAYTNYRRDIENVPMPLDRGVSTNIDKSLEFTNIFGKNETFQMSDR